MLHPLSETDRELEVGKAKIAKLLPLFLSYLTKRCKFYLFSLAKSLDCSFNKYLLKNYSVPDSGSDTVVTVLDKTWEA